MPNALCFINAGNWHRKRGALQLLVTQFFVQLCLLNAELILCKLKLGNVSLISQYGLKPHYLICFGTVHRMPKIPILLQT